MIIYTDGSCSKNGCTENTGGFGVVVLDDNENVLETYSKANTNTSNNREEIRAILYAFIKYGSKTADIPILYTDSAYCVGIFTDWMFRWAKNDWKKGDNKEPENLDLISAFYDRWQNDGYRIFIKKVPGHSGHKWNELADKLATTCHK